MYNIKDQEPKEKKKKITWVDDKKVKNKTKIVYI